MNLLFNIIKEVGRGRGGRSLKAGTPEVFAQCQATGHFELPRGVFPTDWGWAKGFQKRNISFWMFSHSFSHIPWRKTSNKEKDLEVQIAHLTRKISNFSGLLHCGRFFLFVFLVVVTKLWQQRCFWYVVRTEIDLGSWNTVFLKTLLPFMELNSASFYASGFLHCSIFPIIIQIRVCKTFWT